MSVFTKIISGEIPCHKIAENEDFIAFLDIDPLVMGHVLVVPKTETDKIFDLQKTARYLPQTRRGIYSRATAKLPTLP